MPHERSGVTLVNGGGVRLDAASTTVLGDAFSIPVKCARRVVGIYNVPRQCGEGTLCERFLEGCSAGVKKSSPPYHTQDHPQHHIQDHAPLFNAPCFFHRHRFIMHAFHTPFSTRL